MSFLSSIEAESFDLRERVHELKAENLQLKQEKHIATRRLQDAAVELYKLQQQAKNIKHELDDTGLGDK